MRVPEGWSREPLERLATVQTGLAKSPKKVECPVTLPYLRVANVQDGHLDLSEIKTIEVEESKVARYSLKPGDVLFTEGGDHDKLGRGTVWQGEIGRCLHQNHIFAVRVDRSRIEPQFLAGLAASSYGKSYFLGAAKRTTNLASINSTQLKAFPILLPPLPEQRKIAAILSSVDNTIEKTETVIERLQDVKKALMQELLTRGLPGRHTRFKKTEIGEIPETWQLITLGDVAQHVTSGSRGWARYYAEEGALFLRITNVKRNTTRLNFSDLKHVRLPESATEGQRTRVAAGDILISITADLGAVGLIPRNWSREAYINQHLALVRIRPSEHLTPGFAGWFLAGAAGKKQFRLLNDGGAKAGLNLQSIRRVFVPVPSLEEQTRITMTLEKIEDHIEQESSVSLELGKMKSALMSVLLTGEVRVTPDEAPA